MTQTFSPAPQVGAVFGHSHGYTIDGEVVHFNAEILVQGPALACTLQLWASNTPWTGNAFAGTCIAETHTYLTPGSHLVNASAEALLPAGSGDHAIFLALTTVDANGQQVLLDVANYPRRESFLLPRLAGSVGYRFHGSQVYLSAASIENARPAGAGSEGLVLELWALPEAYEGGYFSGYGLASADIGRLAGQFGLTQCEYLVALTPPADGTWHLAMMLREWTPHGYRTRDYVNFGLPVSFPIIAPADGSDLSAHADLPEAADLTEEPTHAQCFHEEAPVAEAAAPEAEAAAPVAEEVVAADKPAAKKKPAKAAKVVKTELPSVNKADVKQLAEVKGLSKTVAAAIIVGRPYASLDDLLRVKGLGQKMLDKIRDQVTL